MSAAESDDFLTRLRQMSQDLNAAEAYGRAFKDGYEKGRADERERAAERVEALPNTWGDWVDQEQAAAAVRHE